MANERSLIEEQNRYDRILELAPAKEAVSIEIAFVFVIKWSLDKLLVARKIQGHCYKYNIG